MTRAEIFIIFAVAFVAATVIAPSDYEHALIQDAMRKDSPMPPQSVFEPREKLLTLTHPLQCDATVNGKCYVKSSSRR